MLGDRPGDKVRFDLERGERAVLQKAELSRMSEIVERFGTSPESGVASQRKPRREWFQRIAADREPC